MNVVLHMKLFDSCVKPILLYCSEIWAMPLIVKDGINIEAKYDSFHPNRIQIKLAKYILGVHKSAINIAVLGELGLYPLSIHSLKSCINYWLYLVNTKENSLVFYSYKENILLQDGLFNKAKKFLTDIGFRHVWDNQGKLSRVALLESMQSKLEERYENFCNNLLSQNNDNIWGRNKLRSYRKLKANFEAEKYLYTDVDKCSISSFVGERISNCNLDIERGRYSKLPVEQRICRLCRSEVEDEFHFIMHCPKLSAYRVDLFESLSLVIPLFSRYV